MPGYERAEVTETVVRYTVSAADGYACGGYVAEAIQHAYDDKKSRGLIRGHASVDDVLVRLHDDELHIEYRVTGPLPAAVSAPTTDTAQEGT